MAGKQPTRGAGAAARWREEDRRTDWRHELSEKLNSTQGALAQFHRDFHGDEDKARLVPLRAAGGGGWAQGGSERVRLAAALSSSLRRPAGKEPVNRFYASAAAVARRRRSLGG